MYIDDVKPVVEIFAELAFAHVLAQIAVGGGHDADIGFDVLVAADSLEGARFEDAQEPDLGGGVDFADLVQKERTAVGETRSAPDAREWRR